MLQLMLAARRRAKLIGNLPEGDAGVAATVAAMQAIIDHAVWEDPDAGRMLRDVVGKIPSGGPRDVGAALFAWARRHVQFKRDQPGTEFIRLPRELLSRAAAGEPAEGDCDDLTVLLCALIATANLRPVIITVAPDPKRKYKHVFAGIRLDDGELSRESVLPLDPQEVDVPGAWPARGRLRLWSVTVTPPPPAA